MSMHCVERAIDLHSHLIVHQSDDHIPPFLSLEEFTLHGTTITCNTQCFLIVLPLACWQQQLPIVRRCCCCVGNKPKTASCEKNATRCKFSNDETSLRNKSPAAAAAHPATTCKIIHLPWRSVLLASQWEVPTLRHVHLPRRNVR